MAKKIDYASLFTLRKDGRYQKNVTIEGKIKHIYDRDPKKLYEKWQQLEAPQPPTFEKAADAWQDFHWENIRDGTKTVSYTHLRRRRCL